MSEVVGVFSWMCGEGWLAVLTPATLSDLSFVSSHPGPLAPPPTPCPLTATNKRTSWVRRRRWRRWWGHLFYDFFAIFFLLPPFRFSGPFVPASSSGVGGHHLYSCLGIKAPWPLLLRGGLGQRWLGQGARGRGGLPFVPASRVGFSSHRPGSRRGGPGPRSMTAMR